MAKFTEPLPHCDDWIRSHPDYIAAWDELHLARSAPEVSVRHDPDPISFAKARTDAKAQFERDRAGAEAKFTLVAKRLQDDFYRAHGKEPPLQLQREPKSPHRPGQ